MDSPEETLDLVASLSATPREERRGRLGRLARPTLEALALVLLEEQRTGGEDAGPGEGR